jgi:hypothetical protein
MESFKEKGFWWVSIFGWVLSGKDLRNNPLLFSERYGYTKFIKIGNWALELKRRR